MIFYIDGMISISMHLNSLFWLDDLFFFSWVHYVCCYFMTTSDLHTFTMAERIYVDMPLQNLLNLLRWVQFEITNCILQVTLDCHNKNKLANCKRIWMKNCLFSMKQTFSSTLWSGIFFFIFIITSSKQSSLLTYLI